MTDIIDECISPGLKPVKETIVDLLAEIVVTNQCEVLELDQALDRVLAEPITCPFNFPPWPASAMDGYAFKHRDDLTNFELKIIGIALAGHPFNGAVAADECVRIMTGAPMPENTDTVEMQEHCQANNDSLQLQRTPQAFQNVRQIGSSIKAGQEILQAGIKLGPKELAIISSSGIAEVTVYKPLTVAIFTTGDELIAPGNPLAPGQIYDSNRLTMLTMCRRMGFDVKDFGLVADDPESIRQVMLEAASCADVLMTSGGVSVGDADYIKPILEEIGKLNVWKVAIKPGKPIAIGQIQDCYFFGLPGNPVSTMVTLNKLVKPALQKLSGEVVTYPDSFSAICTTKLRKAPGRRDYQRGYATTDENGYWHVKSTGPQGSGRLISVAEANCYIILEPSCAGVEEGETVTIELFDEMLS